MKRIAPYIAVSAGLHLGALPLLQLARIPGPDRPVMRTAIRLEMVQDERVAISPPPSLFQDRRPVVPQAPVHFRKPAVRPSPGPLAKSRPSRPESILRQRRLSLELALGLTARVSVPTREAGEPITGGAAALVTDRAARWGRPEPEQGPGDLLSRIPVAALVAASEGTAFYAAYQANDPFAMVAVGGLSLTKGTLRSVLGAVARKVARRTWSPDDLRGLRPGSLDVLEQVWANDAVELRGIYQSLLSSGSLRDLEDELSRLVELGVLRRSGKGRKAAYTALMDPPQILKALTATDSLAGNHACIVRLARLDPMSFGAGREAVWAVR